MSQPTIERGEPLRTFPGRHFEAWLWVALSAVFLMLPLLLAGQALGVWTVTLSDKSPTQQGLWIAFGILQVPAVVLAVILTRWAKRVRTSLQVFESGIAVTDWRGKTQEYPASAVIGIRGERLMVSDSGAERAIPLAMLMTKAELADLKEMLRHAPDAAR